jgi:hypothetical protein
MLRDFSGISMVGFSGARAPRPVTVRAVQAALTALPADVSVVVGCANGVDALVRAACPSAQVFRADDYGVGRGALAARSIACLRAVAAAGGVWVSLPDRVCPVGLRPSAMASACFAGYGSGSWASLALAMGLGVRCAIFLGDIPAPVGWPLVALAGASGWFIFTPDTSASQVLLFCIK